MNISRPSFPTPILCIDDFLAPEEAGKVLQECLDLRKVYMPAAVFDGPTATKIDPRYRKNEVVYLDEVFRAAPERSDILSIIRKKIWTDECKRLWHEGYYIFDIINYATWQEVVISRYAHENFYKKHQDTRRDHITCRLVTLVYYVNKVPEQFTGGALVLYHNEEHIRIEPKHNRAVVFPSFTYHEVESVTMNSDLWEEGRFSLNCWLGFR
jgi:2OG-Fe(II) oxygenase superfamily